MALSSFQLFLSQVQSAPEVLKIRVLQIIFDILMVHEGAFLGPGSPNGDKIVDFLLQLLEAEELERVQALLVVGIAKLMLSGMVTDERVSGFFLILLYFGVADVRRGRSCRRSCSCSSRRRRRGTRSCGNACRTSSRCTRIPLRRTSSGCARCVPPAFPSILYIGPHLTRSADLRPVV